MVSTYTTNIQLEEPARGDQVGTWDTPVNNNMTLLDLVVGGRTTISLNNSPVVLASAQFQCKTITFNSTLTGSVPITFPTSFTKSYEIYHTCTGSSAFVITLQTTAAGGQVVCCPPGEIIEVINDGTNIRFKNMGRVGGYWDYAGSSVPAWVSGCTVPPYLNCDGSTFSATTYPQLSVILGSTTLPDSKGRSRFTLDQSAGRISSAATGFSGSSVGSGGGAQTTTLSSQNMPPIPLTDPGHTHAVTYPTGSLVRSVSGGTEYGGGAFGASGGAVSITSAVTGITAGNSSPTSFTNLPPAYVGGLTLIRAA